MIRRAGSCVLAMAALMVLPLAVAFGQAPTPTPPQDDYIIRSTVNNIGDYLYVRIPPENDNGFDLVLRRANGTESTILRCANTGSGQVTLTSLVPPGVQVTGYLEGFGRYFNLNDNQLAAVRIALASSQDGSDQSAGGHQAVVTVTSAGVVNTIVLEGDTINSPGWGNELVGTDDSYWETNVSPVPGLNNAGQVVFTEGEIHFSYTSPGGSHSDDTDRRIIRYTPPSTYETLIHRGDQIGGASGPYVLATGGDDHSNRTLQINESGHVVTHAQVTPSWPPSNPAPMLFSLMILNGPGNLTEVKRTGTTDALVEVDEGVLNNSDQVLYKSTDVFASCGPAVMPHEHLVRFTPPSTYTLIGHSGDDIPGTAAGGPVLQGFGVKYAMNNLGHVAFVAGIEIDPSNPGQSPGGPNACVTSTCAQDQILFFWNGTSLQPIARTTTLSSTDCAGIASGLGGFNFEWFGNFVHLNDNDTIVFFAENGLCNYPNYGQEDSGWFSWTSATGLQKVVAEGDAAQGGVITNLDPKPGQDKQRMLSNTNAFAISAAINGPVGQGQDDEDVPLSFIPAVVAQQLAAEQIPFLGSWAAALLTLLLVGAGLALLRRTAVA